MSENTEVLGNIVESIGWKALGELLPGDLVATTAFFESLRDIKRLEGRPDISLFSTLEDCKTAHCEITYERMTDFEEQSLYLKVSHISAPVPLPPSKKNDDNLFQRSLSRYRYLVIRLKEDALNAWLPEYVQLYLQFHLWKKMDWAGLKAACDSNNVDSLEDRLWSVGRMGDIDLDVVWSLVCQGLRLCRFEWLDGELLEAAGNDLSSLERQFSIVRGKKAFNVLFFRDVARRLGQLSLDEYKEQHRERLRLCGLLRNTPVYLHEIYNIRKLPLSGKISRFSNDVGPVFIETAELREQFIQGEANRTNLDMSDEEKRDERLKIAQRKREESDIPFNAVEGFDSFVSFLEEQVIGDKCNLFDLLVSAHLGSILPERDLVVTKAKAVIKETIIEREREKSRVAEKERIMSDMFHKIKGLIQTHVIDPLVPLEKYELIADVLRGARLLRQIVYSMNESLSSEQVLESFNKDFGNERPEADPMRFREILFNGLKASVANMFDPGSFNRFYKIHFCDGLEVNESLEAEARAAFSRIGKNDMKKLCSFCQKYLNIGVDVDKIPDPVMNYSIGNSNGSALRVLIFIQELFQNAVKQTSLLPKDERWISLAAQIVGGSVKFEMTNTQNRNNRKKGTGIGSTIVEKFAQIFDTAWKWEDRIRDEDAQFTVPFGIDFKFSEDGQP